MPDGKVSLLFTSPPYALHFKKEGVNSFSGRIWK
jgi:hypothetical protein